MNKSPSDHRTHGRLLLGALAVFASLSCTSSTGVDAGGADLSTTEVGDDRPDASDAPSDLSADAPALDAPPLDAPPLDAPPLDAPPLDAPPLDAARDVPAMDVAREGGGMMRDGGGMMRDAAITDGDLGPTMSVDVFTDEVLSAPELLARPTDRAITVHVVPAMPLEVYYEWGTAPGVYTARSEMQTGATRTPLVTVLSGLTAGTRHFYRMRFRRPGETAWQARPEHAFFTRRPRGASFTFTLQADSHLDDRSDYAVYTSTLANVVRDQPDFHVDLGDTFMGDKHMVPFTPVVSPAMDPATVDARYAFDRANFARITHSIPLFLVNGNHEGESGWQLNGTPNNIAVWATLARKRYFPNPVADDFYSGSTTPEPIVGVRESYYAFEWGDALFVMLDPFWYTRTRPNTDRWRWTLGEAQYQWLRRVVEASTARFKFVFLHHLVGGATPEARGGAEAAPLFEWGGLNEDRTPGFATQRPGWPAPIHQILRDGRVTAVFHGHDHVYVRQEYDGITYQEVPQPSASNFTNGATIAMEGGYRTGDVRSSSGHLRVTVSPDRAEVTYVRATPPAGMRIPDGGLDGHAYTLTPR
jgi:hypothetical protein